MHGCEWSCTSDTQWISEDHATAEDQCRLIVTHIFFQLPERGVLTAPAFALPLHNLTAT